MPVTPTLLPPEELEAHLDALDCAGFVGVSQEIGAHVSALESELAEEREERLAECAAVTECMSARRERDEARADNAANGTAMVSAAAELRHTYGHVALGQNINPDLVARAIRLLEEATNKPHPGAALLAKHAKALKDAEDRAEAARLDYAILHSSIEGALKRVRNEGLATAATMVRNVGLVNLASVIDAAKEPEE